MSEEVDHNGESYSAEIDGNVVIVGKTNSGKTSLICKWAKSKFFDVEAVYWVSPNALPDQTQEKINDSFTAVDNVKYFNADNVDALSSVISSIKTIHSSIGEDEDDIDELVESDNESDTSSTSDLSAKPEENEEQDFNDIPKKIRKGVVIFDDMTNIADKSNTFIHFLTVSRKLKLTTCSVFHQMQLQVSRWETLIGSASLIVLFNCGIVNNSIKRLLSQNSDLSRHRYVKHRRTYVSQMDTWLSHVYQDVVVHKKEYAHLLIDKRDKTESGPVCYRSNTGNDKVQTCFYANPDCVTSYQTFLAYPNTLKQTIFEIQTLVEDLPSGERCNVNAKATIKKQYKERRKSSINNGTTITSDSKKSQSGGLVDATTRSIPRFLKQYQR